MSPEEEEELGGSCPRQVFPDRAWTRVGPSPWAWHRGLSSLWVSGVPWIHLPAGSLEHLVCLC